MYRIRIIVVIAVSAYLLFVQQARAQEYGVTVAEMAYLHQGRDSILLSKDNTLLLKDSVSINNKYGINQVKRFGKLGIESREPVLGEHFKQTVKDMFFKTEIQRIKEQLTAIITNMAKTRDYTKPAGHVQGAIPYTKGLLDVTFYVGESSFSSIEQLPFDTSFEIGIKNNTSSTKYYAIVCDWSTDKELQDEYAIIDGMKDDPIILVPNESVRILAPFIRSDGFFQYRINIYGAESFFMIDYNPKKNNIFTVSINEDNADSVERYFYAPN